MKKKIIPIFLMVTLFLYTCNRSKNKSYDDKQASQTIMLDAKWALNTIDGKSPELIGDDERPYIIINVDENNFAGKGTCNQLFGAIEFDDNNSITITRIGCTKMMCPNIDLEDKFVQALEKVESYQLKDVELNFFAAARKELMSFKKVEIRPKN